ncbi:podoplanin isoform X3 [Meriones unguiculatus]|uniref:podoplanin isoform X3 n=1 Tax=Meriones unguiculatus TaxID=10047 RepID=UPI000B4F096F|nr:podoplanin isoform X3 [Meriones unguiculatus]
MWTAPVLLWVLGSAWFWDSALGGPLGRIEDDIVTPGTGAGLMTPGLEDRTTGAIDGLSEPTGKVPTHTQSTTKPPIEELPTPGTSDRDHEEHESTTTVTVVTSHPSEKKTSHPNRDNAADETQTTDKKGLAVVTLVGIIVGVLLAIGFVGGIIIVVMRKISGRFSP